ncbi:MAG: RDD family protein [Planctomycetota bacterium]
MPRRSEQIDSRTQIVTPENIAFEYRTAGPFSRLGAYLIDVMVQLVTVFLTIFVFFLSYILVLTALQVRGGMSFWGVIGNLGTFTVFTLWFFMQWFYGAYFEYRWNGQTPGKRSANLRVLQVDGRPITLKQALLRNIVRLIDAWPPLPLGQEVSAVVAFLAPIACSTHLVGLTAASLTRRHQRLGDLVCGTMVVAEERTFVGQFEPPDDERVRELIEALPAGYVPSRPLLRAVSHYVGRRKYFGPARRQEIARHVGKELIDRLTLPQDTDCDLLLCALYTKAIGESPLAEAAAPPAQAKSLPPAEPVGAASGAGGKQDDATDWESIPLG